MKTKILPSHSSIKSVVILALLVVFLSISLFNQTPFIKDLTSHPTSEILLEANALTFIKKPYKTLAQAQILFLYSDYILLLQESQSKEATINGAEHFFEIDRIHSMYSNIPPPILS